jgi:hypothetical protein
MHEALKQIADFGNKSKTCCVNVEETSPPFSIHGLLFLIRIIPSNQVEAAYQL